MTDRIIAYSVMLDKSVREDDAEAIQTALMMVKGVLTVVPITETAETDRAYMIAKRDISDKLWAVLFPKDGK